MTKKIFVGLRGVSYGRADIRVNKNGEPYFLEMNPNCGIFYKESEAGSADFILLNDPTMKHDAFLEHIIACAIKRHKAKVNKYEVRWYKKTGYPQTKVHTLTTSDMDCMPKKTFQKEI
jgi:D-alanine-D-alanine ligase